MFSSVSYPMLYFFSTPTDYVVFSKLNTVGNFCNFAKCTNKFIQHASTDTLSSKMFPTNTAKPITIRKIKLDTKIATGRVDFGFIKKLQNTIFFNIQIILKLTRANHKHLHTFAKWRTQFEICYTISICGR